MYFSDGLNNTCFLEAASLKMALARNNGQNVHSKHRGAGEKLLIA